MRRNIESNTVRPSREPARLSTSPGRMAVTAVGLIAGVIAAAAFVSLTGVAKPEARVEATSATSWVGGSESGPEQGHMNARERRLLDAYERMGVESCCGEPSHGGTTSAWGFIWHKTEVAVFAAEPAGSRTPASSVGHQPAATEKIGDTTVVTFRIVGRNSIRSHFVCGDTRYELSIAKDPSTRVPHAAIAALVRGLPCSS